MGSVPEPCEPWWKDAVVYQVYPASFKDSNGDGIGDIPGLISKLGYLKDLGVDTIWLNPMYKSPQVDMGYDISDFEAIHEPFGTMSDMEDLIEGLHGRGIRLILDLVINHTSDQHQWFKESRASKDSPKRDWYIWRPPRYTESGERIPPSNWRANFGGSVWEWDEATQEYYLHYFAREQPDLNWDNPETRNAIYDSAIRFWLKKGVDGFRIDTVNKYSKPAVFIDAEIQDPNSPWQYAYPLFCNGPRMHEFLKEMNREALQPFGDIMTVGELPCTPDPVEIMRYVSASEHELNMVFNFDMVYLGMGTVRKYIPQSFTLQDFKKSLGKWQRFIQGKDTWTTVFAENHDSARSISRFAGDGREYRTSSAKLFALMLTTLTGTLFLYQGQEIGMENIPKSWNIEEYKDLETQNFYAREMQLNQGDPMKMRDTMKGIQYLARDHARTPFQWDGSKNAGFSEGTPWMRVHDNYPEVNVEKQVQDNESPLSFWKKMLKFRKEHRQLFTFGTFKEYHHENEHLFAYSKEASRSTIPASSDVKGLAYVVLNFSQIEQALVKPTELAHCKWDMAISTLHSDCKHQTMVLEPYEGRIYWITKQ